MKKDWLHVQRRYILFNVKTVYSLPHQKKERKDCYNSRHKDGSAVNISSFMKPDKMSPQ